jgi:hypothetical protein
LGIFRCRLAGWDFLSIFALPISTKGAGEIRKREAKSGFIAWERRFPGFRPGRKKKK